MNEQVKQQIINAVLYYADKNRLSQADIAELSGINVSYINALYQGNFFVKSQTGRTEISDLYFRKLAKFVGYDFEPVYWELVETPQYLQIHTELLDAKNSGRMKMLIGSTGCGKTYTISQFFREHPVNTYCITVSSLHNLNDIINELCELLDVTTNGTRVSRLKKAANKLSAIKLAGGRPVLVLDEAENLRSPALKMLKALYDAIKDSCAIVLVGTGQLTEKLEILEGKNVEGIPQFCRRFKAGRRDIIPLSKRMFAPFLGKVEDENVRTLVETLSTNYGELNDYLEPALREADRNGTELNEANFRFMFGLVRR